MQYFGGVEPVIVKYAFENIRLELPLQTGEAPGYVTFFMFSPAKRFNASSSACIVGSKSLREEAVVFPGERVKSSEP